MPSKLYPIILFTAIAASFVFAACGSKQPDGPASPALLAVLGDNGAGNIYAVKPADAPDEGCVRLRVRNLGGPFGKIFNDSNYRHLEHARAGGIVPLNDIQTAWEQCRGLVEVKSTQYLFIDSLSHSYPYLKPHAARLLEEIGRRFADSLSARGGGDYRLKVTSMLRSPLSVGKLRRVNRNATAESAHQYATTFDISYSKFICDNPASTRRTFEDLKNLLAEIVYDMCSQGRCLVKHERKQACFHITATTDSVRPR